MNQLINLKENNALHAVVKNRKIARNKFVFMNNTLSYIINTLK